jgi:heme-degrading monooxygenase HmoA
VFARVTRYERFDQDEAIRFAREQFIPAAQRSGGFEGMYVLVDPDGSGNALALTLWESREAMQASEEMGASSREEVVRRAGGSVVGVERYEVALSPEQATGPMQYMEDVGLRTPPDPPG